MGTLMAYGPDVVGLPGGPMHGLVELWKNSNIGATFNAQSVQIDNVDIDKIDSFIIVTERIPNERYGSNFHLYDKEIMSISGWTGYLDEYLWISASTSRMTVCERSIAFSISGTTLTVTFGNCTSYEQTSLGSAVTQAAANDKLMPVRILGLLHND